VDDAVVGDRLDGHRLLGEAKEKLATAFGSSAIEAERELVHVVVKVFPTDRALVRPQQPPFEERDHQVDPGQQLRRRFLLPSEHRDLVVVAFTRQGRVPRPAIGMDDATALNRILYERHQAFVGSIDHLANANPADPRPVCFRGHYNQRFLQVEPTW